LIKKYIFLLLVIISTLSLLLFSGCSPGCAAPAEPGGETPGAPLTEGQISFSVNPPDIQPGGCAELSWNVPSRQVFGIMLNGQQVSNSGKKQVCPGATEVYNLDVDIGSAMLHKEVTLNVSAPGQQGSQGQGQQPPQPPQPGGSPTVTDVYAYFPGYQPTMNYTGPCPATHAFVADITVNGPCTVTYKWERSDGALAQVETAVFNAPGAQQVSTTWTLGGGGTVWQQVHILTPVSMVSNQAVLTFNCTP
jgi:hypothetical protein